MRLLLLTLAACYMAWYGYRWLKRHPEARTAALNWLWVTALILLTLFLLARGHTAAVFLLFGIALPLAQRWYEAWAQLRRQSQLRTRFLQMQMAHATGQLTGMIIAGSHQGQNLDTLSLDALEALLTTYQQIDPDSARLLASYLKQRQGQKAPQGHTPMSRAEAQAILGVSAQASTEEIRQAHRRLIQKLHPDRGGSDYLAAQINRAKRVLMGE